MSLMCCCSLFVFFFKQKTAYEMRISDWSSDVCSSDLTEAAGDAGGWTLGVFVLVRNADAAAKTVTVEGMAPLSVPAAGEGVIPVPLKHFGEIGRASCRERVCQYVSISGVDVSLNTNNNKKPQRDHNKV